jgi:hypothetical protein
MYCKVSQNTFLTGQNCLNYLAMAYLVCFFKLPRLLPKDVGPIVMLLDKLGCDRSLFDVIEIMHYNIAICTVYMLLKWCCSPFLNKTKAKCTVDCITLTYFILYSVLHIALYHHMFKFLLK